DPPRGVGRELVAPAVLELLDSADEALVALLDEVEEAHAAAVVLLRDGHDQAQVRLDEVPPGQLAVLDDALLPAPLPLFHLLRVLLEALLGGLALLDATSEVDLLLEGQQLDAADLLQVLPDGVVGLDAGVGHRRGARLELLSIKLLAVLEVLLVQLLFVEHLVVGQIGDEDAALLEGLHQVLEVLLLRVQLQALDGAPERVGDLLAVELALLGTALEQRLYGLGAQPRGARGGLRLLVLRPRSLGGRLFALLGGVLTLVGSVLAGDLGRLRRRLGGLGSTVLGRCRLRLPVLARGGLRGGLLVCPGGLGLLPLGLLRVRVRLLRVRLLALLAVRLLRLCLLGHGPARLGLRGGALLGRARLGRGTGAGLRARLPGLILVALLGRLTRGAYCALGGSRCYGGLLEPGLAGLRHLFSSARESDRPPQRRRDCFVPRPGTPGPDLCACSTGGLGLCRGPAGPAPGSAQRKMLARRVPVVAKRAYPGVAEGPVMRSTSWPAFAGPRRPQVPGHSAHR